MREAAKYEKIDALRMKDIVAQLADIIYLLCDAKDADSKIIISRLTNLTAEEKEILHLRLPSEQME